jgi:hypothetical protein
MLSTRRGVAIFEVFLSTEATFKVVLGDRTSSASTSACIVLAILLQPSADGGELGLAL